MGLRADEGADDVEILRYIERYRHRRDLIYVYRVVAANCIGLGLQTCVGCTSATGHSGFNPCCIGLGLQTGIECRDPLEPDYVSILVVLD